MSGMIRLPNFTDMGIDPNRTLERFRPNSRRWCFAEGLPGEFNAANLGPNVSVAAQHPARCVICENRRNADWNFYCLGCDRCGADGKVEYPGLPIGSRMQDLGEFEFTDCDDVNSDEYRIELSKKETSASIRLREHLRRREREKKSQKKRKQPLPKDSVRGYITLPDGSDLRDS